MTTVQYVFDRLAARLQSPEFQRTYARKPKDFSRHRKVGLVSLVSGILNGLVLTTTVELSKFLQQHLPSVTSYTKQSFSEARQKLDPRAFVDLNDTLVRYWYEANEYTVIAGTIRVAIDGSTLEIPNTAKLREVYGETGGKQAPGLARAQMSHAYDVANGICLSAVLDRYEASERDLALRNMRVFGQQEFPNLVKKIPHLPGEFFETKFFARDLRRGHLVTSRLDGGGGHPKSQQQVT